MPVKWKVSLAAMTIIAAVLVFTDRSSEQNRSVRIADHDFEALLADDQEERVRGLSGKMSLADDTVMLFVFPDDARHGIWMRDMRFAIDILWLDRDGRIISIAEHISPDTYPTVFRPETAARFVIEMKAGSVARYGIQLGQHMEAWPSG